MKPWENNQPAAEEWMERNFEDSPGVLRMRDRPLDGTEYEGKNTKWRQEVERDLPDKTFLPTWSNTYIPVRESATVHTSRG